MPGFSRMILPGSDLAGSVEGGPIQLTVILEERRLPPADVTACETPFDLSFAIPADVVSKNKIAVTLIVDHTFQAPPDPRQLGWESK